MLVRVVFIDVLATVSFELVLKELDLVTAALVVLVFFFVVALVVEVDVDVDVEEVDSWMMDVIQGR